MNIDEALQFDHRDKSQVEIFEALRVLDLYPSPQAELAKEYIHSKLKVNKPRQKRAQSDDLFPDWHLKRVRG